VGAEDPLTHFLVSIARMRRLLGQRFMRRTHARPLVQ